MCAFSFFQNCLTKSIKNYYHLHELVERGIELLPLGHLLHGQPVVHEDHDEELANDLAGVDLDELDDALASGADAGHLEAWHRVGERPAAAHLAAPIS